MPETRPNEILAGESPKNETSPEVFPNPKRCPLNVPGPFYTLGECLMCGAPEHEAPDLMAPLDGDNTITHFRKQPTTPEEVDRACKAIDSCCVEDLRYGGTDPAIILRLGNNPRVCDYLVGEGGRLVPATRSGDTRSG